MDMDLFKARFTIRSVCICWMENLGLGMSLTYTQKFLKMAKKMD